MQHESIYLTTAYLIRAGTVFADSLGISVISGIAADGHVAPQYPPGLGVLIAPALSLHWRAAFIVPIAAHLTGGLLFAALLRRLHICPVWALLCTPPCCCSRGRS